MQKFVLGNHHPVPSSASMFSDSLVAENGSTAMIDNFAILNGNIIATGIKIVPFLACMVVVQKAVLPLIKRILNSTSSKTPILPLNYTQGPDNTMEIVTCSGCTCHSEDPLDHMDYGGCMYSGLEF